MQIEHEVVEPLQEALKRYLAATDKRQALSELLEALKACPILFAQTRAMYESAKSHRDLCNMLSQMHM